MGVKQILVICAMVFVGCGFNSPNEAANELFVEAVELISRADETTGQSAIDLYEQGLGKLEEITTKHSKSDLAVKLISDETLFTNRSLKEIRDKVNELKRQVAESKLPEVKFADPVVEKEIRDYLKDYSKRHGVPRSERLLERDLQNVKMLNLSGTQITDEGLKEVAKLQNLGSLYLRDTQITGASLKELTKLQKFYSLGLTATQITDAGLVEVAKLQNLISLYLVKSTQFTDAGLVEVAKLQKLTSLGLDETKITDAGLKEVAKLQKLYSLGLGYTQITDAGLKEVAKLQNLDVLNLQRTQITDAGLKELAKLKKLRSLFLYNTQVTKAGVAELKKALPSCNIYGP